MSYLFDIGKLRQMIRAKRGDRTLREVSTELDAGFGYISPSTLSRIENGKDLDIPTLGVLCSWLGVSPGDFWISSADVISNASDTVTAVAAILYADARLSEKTANAMVHLLEMALETAK